MSRPLLSRMSPLRTLALLLGLCMSAFAAAAGFPAPYAPMVTLPSGTPQRYEFDLTAALRRARREHKRLYVYLGADDCPYCRKYEAFLESNAMELAPHFAKDYLVVDLRSSLSVQADRLYIRVGEKALPYADFQRSIGDERARLLVYPSVWLLDTNAKPLMQMPAGTGTFQTVPEQLEILRLEQ
jgi:thiol-disulfide isomerase/thioredoxin